MEQWKYFRLVTGASRLPSDGVVHALRLHYGAIAADFRQAAFDEFKESLPPKLRPGALKVFANSEAQTPLELDTNMNEYGVKLNDPLIVQVPKVWYQLTDATTAASLTVASAPLTEDDTVDVLLNTVKERFNDSHLAGVDISDLVVFDDNNMEYLVDESQIGPRGKTKKTALIVRVPQRVITSAVPVGETTSIKVIREKKNESALQELERYREQGKLIRDNCKDYCNRILDKIDEYYKNDENDESLPFICV
ncbi:hypothetical protein PR003_g14716, partial [Phytophthora rubi]